MKLFFDETGAFRPGRTGEIELAAVMGVVVPEIHTETLRAGFSTFVETLPREYFQKSEPKGRLLSVDQLRTFATMLNAHRGTMLIPVTFNREIRGSSFDSWPAALRKLLEDEAKKCVHTTMRDELEELARRCANLSPEQLARLLTYKIAVEKAVNAVALFYHCKKYHNSYSPIRVIFDHTGKSNNREELVFKNMVFLWVTKNVVQTVRQIHTESHPFVRLYGARVNGKRAFDISKILRDNFEFRDSKTCWQLQVADIAAAAWVNAIRDQKNTGGSLSLFRLLHRNTSLPANQPVGLMSVADTSSQQMAPESFNIFPRLVMNEGKILPCSWDDI